MLKAVDQASSLNSLIEMVLFEVCPILLDLVVAMYYITHLFDAYMAFIILFMGWLSQEDEVEHPEEFCVER